MSLNDIISQIENDSRNYEYTKRNIPPILQVNSKAKVFNYRTSTWKES